MLAAGQTAVPGRVGREGLGVARTQAALGGGGSQRQAEQNSVLTSILSFRAFLQYEKKQQQTEVPLCLSRGQLSVFPEDSCRERRAELPGGRGSRQGEAFWCNQE